MLIIGCDFHPGFQQVAIFDQETGEIVQRRLAHPQEAMEFYRGLPAGVLVGIESTGFSGWFEHLRRRLRCTALRFVPRSMVGEPEAASRVEVNAKRWRP